MSEMIVIVFNMKGNPASQQCHGSKGLGGAGEFPRILIDDTLKGWMSFRSRQITAWFGRTSSAVQAFGTSSACNNKNIRLMSSIQASDVRRREG